MSNHDFGDKGLRAPCGTVFWWCRVVAGCEVAAADPGYVANVIPANSARWSAFPAEADAVLAHTALDATWRWSPTVVATTWARSG